MGADELREKLKTMTPLSAESLIAIRKIVEQHGLAESLSGIMCMAALGFKNIEHKKKEYQSAGIIIRETRERISELFNGAHDNLS